MSSVTSNLAQVEATLDALAAGLDFTEAGQGRALGLELADLVIDGMTDRTVAEQASPDGSPLAALSPRYLRRKVGQGFPHLIGVRTGQMISRVEMAGRVDVTPERVVIAYGATQEAKDRFLWFHVGCGTDALGRAQNRPPRPIWGLDERIVRELSSYAAERLRVYLERLASGGP